MSTTTYINVPLPAYTRVDSNRRPSSAPAATATAAVSPGCAPTSHAPATSTSTSTSAPRRSLLRQRSRARSEPPPIPWPPLPYPNTHYYGKFVGVMIIIFGFAMLFPLNMMIAVFQQRPITGIWIMYVDLAAIVLGAVLMYGVMKKSILAGKNVGAWTILGCFVVFVVWLSFRCVDVMNGRWGSVFWKY